jgi:hypothetical protein
MWTVRLPRSSTPVGPARAAPGPREGRWRGSGRHGRASPWLTVPFAVGRAASALIATAALACHAGGGGSIDAAADARPPRRAIPVGIHTGATRPFLEATEVPTWEEPPDFADALLLGVGWERPGIHAEHPFTGVHLDRADGYIGDR